MTTIELRRVRGLPHVPSLSWQLQANQETRKKVTAMLVIYRSAPLGGRWLVTCHSIPALIVTWPTYPTRIKSEIYKNRLNRIERAKGASAECHSISSCSLIANGDRYCLCYLCVWFFGCRTNRHRYTHRHTCYCVHTTRPFVPNENEGDLVDFRFNRNVAPSALVQDVIMPIWISS